MEGNKFGDNNKYESVSQSQFQCFHTCPKGNAGRQENSTAYGEHVNKQKNDKEYVCSCMNAETNACKLKLWFCNADCPFTKFEKHAYKTKKGESVHLDIGWQNPIQFKDQQTIGDLTYNLSSHVKSTWHGFWHAVNVFTISGTANTMTHPTKDAHNNSHIRKYRQVRDLLAFYARYVSTTPPGPFRAESVGNPRAQGSRCFQRDYTNTSRCLQRDNTNTSRCLQRDNTGTSRCLQRDSTGTSQCLQRDSTDTRG